MAEYTKGKWSITKCDSLRFDGDDGSVSIVACAVESTWRRYILNHLNAHDDLLATCEYLEKVLLLIERVQCLPVPAIPRNNIECLQQAIAQAEKKK